MHDSRVHECIALLWDVHVCVCVHMDAVLLACMSVHVQHQHISSAPGTVGKCVCVAE